MKIGVADLDRLAGDDGAAGALEAFGETVGEALAVGRLVIDDDGATLAVDRIEIAR